MPPCWPACCTRWGARCSSVPLALAAAKAGATRALPPVAQLLWCRPLVLEGLPALPTHHHHPLPCSRPQPFLSTESISQLVKEAERHVQELSHMYGKGTRAGGWGPPAGAGAPARWR